MSGVDNADCGPDDPDSDGGEAAALISMAFDDDTAIAMELARGRRAITANRRLNSEAVRLRERLAEQRTRAEAAETQLGKLQKVAASATTQRLHDEVARLRVSLAEQRTRADNAETRADAAETQLGKVHQAVAAAAAAHRATVAEVHRDHESELVELRGEHRRVLVEAQAAHAAHVTRLRREHAARMEQVMSRRLTDMCRWLGRVTAEPDPRAAVDAVDAVGELVGAAVAGLVDQFAAMAPGMAPLTRDEASVMRAAARGLTNDETSTDLGFSRKKLETNFRGAYEKLGARHRAPAIAIGLALGHLDVLDLGPELFPDLLDANGAVDRARLRARMMPVSRRTDRDRLVLVLLARGADNPVIKDKLGITDKAVRTSTHLVLDSIGARNRAHAVAILHYLAAVTPTPDPVAADPVSADGPDNIDDAGDDPGTGGSPAEPAALPEADLRPAPPVVDSARPPGTRRASKLSKLGRSGWKAYVRAMVLPEDADPALVAIYNTLTNDQQFTLRALAVGAVETQVARALHLAPSTVQQHIKLMCKRFREDTYFTLAALGRELFNKGEEY